jgi:hypothetical protein
VSPDVADRIRRLRAAGLSLRQIADRLNAVVGEALGLREGDEVVFRIVDGDRAMLSRAPDLLELAGSVPVPPAVRGRDWDDLRRRAWASQRRG